jgi:hypothetical protein
MREDYEYLAQNPAFVSGRVLASRADPGTYFHITHWTSLEALQQAIQDPEVQRIFGQLNLSGPLESHLSDAVVFAADGQVYPGANRDSR